MQNVFETEIGLVDCHLNFINTTGKFIPLGSPQDTDMLISIVHDEAGKASSIALISTATMEELCLVSKFDAERLPVRKERSSQMLKAFKEGSSLNVPEMLVNIWESIKPIAVSAALNA